VEFLAQYLANPLTIYSVVGALVIWAGSSSIQLYRQTKRLIAVLRSARAVVEERPDAPSFAGNFERVAQQLAVEGPLSAPWSAYRDTLIVPDNEAAPRLVRTTLLPENVFDLRLLRTFGIRSRYHGAMPGMLVGAGLLFTFLGLAVALGVAGGVVAEGDPAQSRYELHKLLDTASFKFITSLAGLFLSITYTLFRNARLRMAEQALDGFNTALERRMPFATPAALQHEANRTLNRQLGVLDTFSNDLAIGIGQALDTAFDQRLGEHIGPLKEAIQSLAERIGTHNEDAMRQMLQTFTDRLSGGTREHLVAVSEKLETLGIRLEGLLGRLDDASTRMTQAAEAMAQRMGDGAEAALARMTGQMSGFLDTLRTVAAQTREAGAEAAQALAARLEAAAASFETAAQQMTDRLSESAKGTSEAFSQAARGTREALAQGADHAARQLQDAATAVRKMLDTTGDGLARQAAALAAAAEALHNRISELDRSAREAIAPLAAGAAELRQAAQSAHSATEPLRQVASSLNASVERMNNAAQTFAAAQASAAKLSNEMTTAAQRFEGVDQNLARTVTSLGEALGGFAGEIQKFVTDTNRDLAIAAKHISGLVAELNDTLEDFGFDRRPPTSPQPRPRAS
jgi:DNA anti-recombination protein RmuC